ncbi:hypothetical protein BSZ19_43130 [Bradyrhizobium japonicum]|uniref:Uncharacterized protein n=1 Tax=Bradyrhizobium japonicum TaxID=375 RepID=A0A1Y2JAL5_BRAJP|nr:hypothetical protein BSZ19_43130 [Bradyrhizobium japonicum]
MSPFALKDIADKRPCVFFDLGHRRWKLCGLECLVQRLRAYEIPPGVQFLPAIRGESQLVNIGIDRATFGQDRIAIGRGANQLDQNFEGARVGFLLHLRRYRIAARPQDLQLGRGWLTNIDSFGPSGIFTKSFLMEMAQFVGKDV